MARRKTTPTQSGLSMMTLPPQTKPGDECLVAADVLVAQVVQQPATSGDHSLQAASGVDVLAVHPQVVGELLDILGEYRDLDLGGAGVLVVDTVFSNDVLLRFAV